MASEVQRKCMFHSHVQIYTDIMIRHLPYKLYNCIANEYDGSFTAGSV